MSTPPGPTLGPCASWASGADVALCCDANPSSNPSAGYADAALNASMVLYEISGRVFTGLCTGRKVRPCRKRCSCFGGRSASSWWWGASSGLWGWWSEADCGGDRCGCDPLESITLAGYPVREITEVKIDGAVVDPASYRLDRWRYLVRLDAPGPPVVKGYWPSCQNLALDSTQPGTFEVTYSWGVDPPPIGVEAAAELACQLYRACSPGAGECVLPGNVVEVIRQGVHTKAILTNWFASNESTNLPSVDLFLRAYARTRPARRSAVWSPDVEGFPRRMV